MPGERYVLSAWVSEEDADALNFDNAEIKIAFRGATIVYSAKADGEIIDGWQRIEKEFIVPVSATNIQIIMKNNGGNETYFDDIRIHPFSSEMKSFVYDPVSLRLSAELDENNYATFYEYDEEGALIRVKKETERGVKTVRESRNNNPKKQ